MSSIEVNKRGSQNMIVQHTKRIRKWNAGAVIRAVSVGQIEGSLCYAIGTQNKTLIILNEDWEIIQTIEFQQWVRVLLFADLENDGNSELIIGSGDGNVTIFSFIENKFQEKLNLKLKGGITSLALAHFKDLENPILAIGTWNKSIHIFQINENFNNFDLLWEKNELPAPVQQILIDDETYYKYHNAKNNEDKESFGIITILRNHTIVAFDEKNGKEKWIVENKNEKDFEAMDFTFCYETKEQYIVAGGNDKHLYFISKNGQIIETYPFPERITALKVACIDGGNHDEIIVAGGGIEPEGKKRRNAPPSKKNIYTLQFNEPSITSLEERWHLRIPKVITSIIVCDINRDGKEEIVYGGYNQHLIAVQDYFYGERPPFEENIENMLEKDVSLSYKGNELEVPSASSESAKSSLEIKSNKSNGTKTMEPMELLETTEYATSEIVKQKNNTNKEDIEQTTFPEQDDQRKNNLETEQEKLKEETDEEQLEKQKEQEKLKEETDEEQSEKQKEQEKLKEETDEEQLEKQKEQEKLIEKTKSLSNLKAYSFSLSIGEIYKNKNELFFLFEKSDVKESEFGNIIELLKKEGYIKYEKKAPRGYRVLKNFP